MKAAAGVSRAVAGGTMMIRSRSHLDQTAYYNTEPYSTVQYGKNTVCIVYYSTAYNVFIYNTVLYLLYVQYSILYHGISGYTVQFNMVHFVQCNIVYDIVLYSISWNIYGALIAVYRDSLY